MPHEIVIWLDCSTTTCKAPASDRQGRVVAESRATFEELTPHHASRGPAAVGLHGDRLENVTEGASHSAPPK